MTDVYSHPEYRALLAAIRSAPDDDLPRLVCADWLEDWVDANYQHPQSGEAESRAELIRVQCDPLYTVPCAQVTYPLDEVAGQESLWNMGVSCLDFHDGRSERQDRWCPQCKARHRVLQIIEAGDDDTTRHVPHPFSANGWTGFVVKTYYRGFVHTVRGPLGLLHGGECGCVASPNRLDGECRWCGNTGRTPGVLAELLRREPIVCDGIVVTDRSPLETAVGSFVWNWTRMVNFDAPYIIPYEVFNAIEPRPNRGEFPTAAAARLAFSRALYSINAPKSEASR